MSGIFEDNFELYGTSTDRLIQGVWAEENNAELLIPSFETNGRYWLGLKGLNYFVRAVFASGAQASIGGFFEFHTPELPAQNDKAYICEFRNGANSPVLRLKLTTTGNLVVENSAGADVATSTLPAIVAGRTYKIQLQAVLHATTGTVEVRVDKVAVAGLVATGLVLDDGPAAAIALYHGTNSNSGNRLYYKSLAIYSLAGTYNSDWPDISGVASILINEDTATAGLTPRPRKIFDAATFVVPGSGSLLDVGSAGSADFNLGTSDYTLEGTFRFRSLPTGTDYATLFGQWTDSINQRGYRLRLCGPSLEEGGLQFEYSTDGLSGTIVKVHDVQWSPVVGHEYHIAVVRESDENSLYIDGVRQGLPVADAATYHASTARFAVGGALSGAGTPVLAATSMDGSFDEIRMTPGVARYSANFTPHTVPFPRSIGAGDASFASVALLCGFEDGIVDESDFAHVLDARGSGAVYFPQDGDAAYQSAGVLDPLDDRYLEAALVPASGILTFTGLPLNTETVTMGATTYTFRAALVGANDVLIGATIADNIANLSAAVNGGSGEGTVYGTGTTPNVAIFTYPGVPTGSDLTAEAIVPGAAGNSLATTETLTNASWTGATLAGGSDLPGPSLFGIQSLPNTATGVRWVASRHRTSVDAGIATMRADFLVSGVAENGTAQNVSSPSKSAFIDRFEEDPNTTSGLTVTSIVNGQLKLTRTA